MRYVTPLRYPGGKASLAPCLSALLNANGYVRPLFAEPYAGGAGASLTLLFNEVVNAILINDLDYRIFSFWWAVLNRTEEFVARIRTIPLSISEWRRQRHLYRNPRRHARLDVGFATFYLNRTNRSGIVWDGGPIGGIRQAGSWNLDARFTRSALVDRVERISAYRERIFISNADAMTFIHRLDLDMGNASRFLYLDPPYYEKGVDLYLSNYKHEQHVAIGNRLRSRTRSDWALTYDDVPAIRSIYKGCRVLPFSLRYTANHSRPGNELLIVPKKMAVPTGMIFKGKTIGDLVTPRGHFRSDSPRSDPQSRFPWSGAD